MLAKIGLDPKALGENHDAPGLMKSVHLTVLEALNAHGRIVFRNDKEAKRFIDAIRSSSLSPDLAKRWEAVLGSLYACRRAGVHKPQDDLSISSPHQLTDIETVWAGKVNVMILDSDMAVAVGVPPDEGVLDDAAASLELATLPSATLTRTMRHLRQLAASTVFPFANRKSFWSEVLQPVAEVSQSATILDKFVFKELCYRAGQPRRFANSAPEHLVWLLDHFDRSMRPGSSVQIIGFSSPPDPDIEETADFIRKAWKAAATGMLSRVDISLAHRSHGFPHDRHLRFDANVGIALSAGFDRLRQPDCWDPNGMSWSYIYMPADVETLREREMQALQLQTSTSTVLQR